MRNYKLKPGELRGITDLCDLRTYEIGGLNSFNCLEVFPRFSLDTPLSHVLERAREFEVLPGVRSCCVWFPDSGSTVAEFRIFVGEEYGAEDDE